MANNSFAHTTVEISDAKATLKNMYAKAKIVPLTPAELQTARRAVLIIDQHNQKLARIAAEETEKENIERLMKRGYTAQEAYQQLQAEAIADAEARGLGVSQRCRFVRIY